MASIHRKRGASGKVSPFWQAKFRSADGSTVWRSTKQTDSRKAIEVARKWEKAARLAANSELTQSASIRLLDELMEEWRLLSGRYSSSTWTRKARQRPPVQSAWFPQPTPQFP